MNTGKHMSKLSITDAAKAAGVSRSHLYKRYINTGKISIEVVDDKKVIDLSELIRVFGNVLGDANEIHSDTFVNTHKDDGKDKIIAILERELAELRCQAKEREDWLKQQIDELRQQQNYLLENKLSSEKSKRKKFLGIF